MWHVVFAEPGQLPQSRAVRSRDGAIRVACELLAAGCDVRRILEPNGACIERAELDLRDLDQGRGKALLRARRNAAFDDELAGRHEMRANALERRVHRGGIGEQLQRAAGDDRAAVTKRDVEMRDVLTVERSLEPCRAEVAFAARDHRWRLIHAVHLGALHEARHEHAASAAHDVERGVALRVGQEERDLVGARARLRGVVKASCERTERA